MSKRSDDGIMDADDPAAGGERDVSQVAQRHYDPDGNGGLTTAIIYAIAAAEGVEPVEVKSPPLYESVDVPAIEDAFFGPDVAGSSRQGVGTVEFSYADYLVSIGSDGWIQIYEPSDPEQP